MLNEDDMHIALAKENNKALADLHVVNQLKGNFYSTEKTGSLSEYSQQMMKDDRIGNSRALLRNL